MKWTRENVETLLAAEGSDPSSEAPASPSEPEFWDPTIDDSDAVDENEPSATNEDTKEYSSEENEAMTSQNGHCDNEHSEYLPSEHSSGSDY